MRKAGRLKNLKIHEVSLVDLAANNRDFIILKSKEKTNDPENHAITDNEDTLMSFLKKLKKEQTLEPTDDEMLKRKRENEAAEKREKEDKKEKSVADDAIDDDEKSRLRKNGDETLLRKIYKLLSSYLLDEDDNTREGELEEVLNNEDSHSTLLMNKSTEAQMNPDIQKLLKSQRDILKIQHEELTKANAEIQILKQEAEERKKQAFIEKAKSLQILGVDDQFGLILKSLAEKTPQEYEKVLSLLTKAADSLSKSDFLDEIGNGFNRDSQSSVAIVQENANVIQKEKGLSKEQAIAKALEQDPSLYDAYLKEIHHGI